MPLPRLDTLPEELISNIATRLDYDEITQLRLACKAIEAKSFHDFATEYFSSKGFLFTTESLQVLVNIAGDKRLRSYVHRIYIVTALFSDDILKPKCPNGDRCVGQLPVRQSEAMKFYITDQKRLKESGEDKRLLTKAFAELTDVTTVYLCDSPNYEEPSFYGLRKIMRRTERGPTYAPSVDQGKDLEYTRWQSHVWTTLCQSIAESEIRTITAFGANIARADNGLMVRDLRLKTLAGLSKALQNLESVRLTMRGDSLIKRNGTVDPDASAKVMRDLGSALRSTKLEHVKLSYDTTPGSGMLFRQFTKNLQLDKITRVVVDGLSISASSLVATLSGLTSIKDFQITWSNLTSGTWVPVLQAMQKMTELDHLHLMWLQEAGRKVYFLTQKDEDELERQYQDQWDGEGEDDDYDSDDDEIPDLEPAQPFEETAAFPPGPDAMEANSSRLSDLDIGAATAAEPSPDEKAEEEQQEDFIAPGREDSMERGYFVCIVFLLTLSDTICIKGAAQIAKYLPIFIKEYNLGDDLEADMHMPPAAGAFFNALMTGIGLPGAPGPGPGGPAHAHGQGANQGGGGGGGNGGAAANGFGPPPPPGFVPLGGGPGYGMMMGAIPMPPGVGYGPLGGPGGPPAPFAGPQAAGGAQAPPNAMAGAATNTAPGDVMGEDDWLDEEDVPGMD